MNLTLVNPKMLKIRDVKGGSDEEGYGRYIILQDEDGSKIRIELYADKKSDLSIFVEDENPEGCMFV